MDGSIPANDSSTTPPAIDPGRSLQADVSGLREYHATMLAIACMMIAAAFILQPHADARLGLAFLPSVNLPTLCGSRVLFGVQCPGCGLTRSMVALAHGDFAASLAYHRLGWLIALAVVLQIPYRLFCLRELRTNVPTRTWPAWFGYSLVAALVINWLLKVSGVV